MFQMQAVIMRGVFRHILAYCGLLLSPLRDVLYRRYRVVLVLQHLAVDLRHVVHLDRLQRVDLVLDLLLMLLAVLQDVEVVLLQRAL